MNRKIQTIVAAALVVAVTMKPADAQLGKLLREGAEYLGKKAAKVVKEGTEASLKQSDSIVSRAASTSSRSMVSGGIDAGKQVAVQASKGAIAVGRNSADEILAHLGPAGVQSMQKLSPVGASRLADVSAELAKSPHKAEWLRLIGQSGDAVAEFLWKRKGAVAIATATTAVVLAPSDFVQASESVATSAISTVGSKVIQPLITETAQHVAGPLAKEVTKQAAANFPWTLAWCLSFGGVAGGLGFWWMTRR